MDSYYWGRGLRGERIVYPFSLDRTGPKNEESTHQIWKRSRLDKLRSGVPRGKSNCKRCRKLSTVTGQIWLHLSTRRIFTSARFLVLEVVPAIKCSHRNVQAYGLEATRK